MHRKVGIALVVVAALGAASVAQVQASTRPIADFLSKQGSQDWSVIFPGFIEDYLAWTGRPAGNPTAPIDRVAFIDYAGFYSSATNVSGSVVENPLAGGGTEVKVRLRASNVLSYAVDLGGATLFGATPAEVAGGAVPALGSALLELTYTVSRLPGGPMEDVMDVIFQQGGGLTVSFQGTASGKLPDGRPGRMTLSQTGLIEAGIANGFKGALGDAFPAEVIDIRAVGRLPGAGVVGAE